MQICVWEPSLPPYPPPAVWKVKRDQEEIHRMYPSLLQKKWSPPFSYSRISLKSCWKLLHSLRTGQHLELCLYVCSLLIQENDKSFLVPSNKLPFLAVFCSAVRSHLFMWVLVVVFFFFNTVENTLEQFLPSNPGWKVKTNSVQEKDWSSHFLFDWRWESLFVKRVLIES